MRRIGERDEKGRIPTFDTKEETRHVREWLLERKGLLNVQYIEKHLGFPRNILWDVTAKRKKSLHPEKLETLIALLSEKFGMRPPPSMRPPATMRMQYIDFMVCYYYQLKYGSLQKETRKGEIVKARQISIYFCKEYTEYTDEYIGEYFGGKDRTTVLHSCKTVVNLMETDRKYKNEIDEIKKEFIWMEENTAHQKRS